MGGAGDKRALARTVGAVAVIGVVSAGALGCGGDGEGSASAKPVRCKRVKQPKIDPVAYEAPAQTVKRSERLTAVVRTSCGPFRIALDAKRFPTTVNSFVFLARKGFYDGLTFDQASANRYLHGGVPPGRASGPGYRVQGEPPPEGFIYRHAVVAMSHDGDVPSGTAGSEFFIVVAKPWLDFSGVYAPLGKVESGFDVLERITLFGPPDPHPNGGNLGITGDIGDLRRTVLIEGISIERG